MSMQPPLSGRELLESFMHWLNRARSYEATTHRNYDHSRTIEYIRPDSPGDPVEVIIDPDLLRREIPTYLETGRDLWPDAPTELEGASRLLSIHLEESVETSPPETMRVWFDGHGGFRPKKPKPCRR